MPLNILSLAGSKSDEVKNTENVGIVPENGFASLSIGHIVYFLLLELMIYFKLLLSMKILLQEIVFYL